MKAREYMILTECVERGIELGWRRAHKHTEAPTQDQLEMELLGAVMTQINDYFIFDDGTD